MFHRVHGGKCASHGCHSAGRKQRGFGGHFAKGWPAGLHFPRHVRWGVDVESTDQEYVVKAELPGFDVAELDVRLDGDVLTLTASKTPQPDQHAKRPVQRKVRLPEDIDPKKIEAKYVNGILEVRVAKADAGKSKKIDIKS